MSEEKQSNANPHVADIVVFEKLKNESNKYTPKQDYQARVLVKMEYPLDQNGEVIQERLDRRNALRENIRKTFAEHWNVGTTLESETFVTVRFGDENGDLGLNVITNNTKETNQEEENNE
jgi:hypothetical protein